MAKLIFELFGPILLFLYGLIEIILPMLSLALPTKWELDYFWFTKSIFKKKPKTDFAQKVADAEVAYSRAKMEYEELQHSATKEAEDAKQKLAAAEKAYADAVKKQEGFKNN
jgi:hypothetical protein